MFLIWCGRRESERLSTRRAPLLGASRWCATRGYPTHTNPNVFLVRAKGIEPSSSAWEADVLPLYHARALRDSIPRTKKCPVFIFYLLCEYTFIGRLSQLAFSLTTRAGFPAITQFGLSNVPLTTAPVPIMHPSAIFVFLHIVAP